MQTLETKDEKLRIICDLDVVLEIDNMELEFQKVTFDYKNYVITISQHGNCFLEISQIHYDLSNLYSDKQVISMQEHIKIYYLSDFYNKNDILFLYGENNNYAILDSCITYQKKLICGIAKERIEEILTKSNEEFKIGIMNDNFGIYKYESILSIK